MKSLCKTSFCALVAILAVLAVCVVDWDVGLYYLLGDKFVLVHADYEDTVIIKYSEQETKTIYDIKDKRISGNWLPFCYSGLPSDTLKSVVVGGCFAIVSESRPTSILYCFASRDAVYPLSEVGNPRIARPSIPVGYTFEIDDRNESGKATFCGVAGTATVSHPLSVLVNKL